MYYSRVGGNPGFIEDRDIEIEIPLAKEEKEVENNPKNNIIRRFEQLGVK